VYFAHIYTLLVAHPTIIPILTAHPLHSLFHPAGPLLGSAPLPSDYVPPDFVQDGPGVFERYSQGLRGTAISYELAGQKHKKGKEIVKEKVESRMNMLGMDENARRRYRRKEMKDAKAREDALQMEDENGAGPSGAAAFVVDDAEEDQGGDENELIRALGEYDGGGVMTADLIAMTAKWGSRLRLRCTDDEIYFRLTGSYQKVGTVVFPQISAHDLQNSKLTPIVLHVLSLSARSREKGIAAVELGPAVGANQGSIHHYMKVLCSLGLW
jgi:hypothetical protein